MTGNGRKDIYGGASEFPRVAAKACHFDAILGRGGGGAPLSAKR